MPINTFSAAPAIGATGVVSMINPPGLLAHLTGDAYFQNTGDLSRVDIYYTHTGQRQERRVVHEGNTLTGGAEWSSYARPGQWLKSRVVVYDSDNAVHELIGTITGEDLTL